MWDNIKPPNTFVIVLPEEEERDTRKGGKKKKGLKEAKSSQNLI